MNAPQYVNYTDSEGKEYSETATSPIAVTVREDELEASGYTVVR